ncbi:MAG: hypothetical protein HC828_19630, partial [Blastochloris sp.]|nr:hypothetical protein [Blastochloris sp.]
MNEVERIYKELSSIEEIIAEKQSPSDLTAFQANSAKILLLASASYFERRICKDIQEYARELVKVDHIPEFIHNQGLSRKYHALFAWEVSNAN